MRFENCGVFLAVTMLKWSAGEIFRRISKHESKSKDFLMACSV